jgi:hypothetical protein
MSLVEFQISTSAFLAAQRTALRSMQICIPPQPVGGVQVVIEKIDFGNNAIRHNVDTSYTVLFNSLVSDLPGMPVDGFRTQVAQDVVVYLTTMSDIMAHPNEAPVTIVAIPGVLVYDLSFYSLEDDCYTQMSFSGVEPGPLPPIPVAWAGDPRTGAGYGQ